MKTHTETLASACSNSSRCPDSNHTSTAAVVSEPTTVIGPRWRRPKRRRRAIVPTDGTALRGCGNGATGSVRIGNDATAVFLPCVSWCGLCSGHAPRAASSSATR